MGYEEDPSVNQIAASIKSIMLESRYSSITAPYSGGGDDGSIESVEVLDAENKEVETFDNRLDDLLWDLLDGMRPGFQNNEEGNGTLTLKIDEGDLIVDLDHYFVTTESDGVSFSV